MRLQVEPVLAVAISNCEASSFVVFAGLLQVKCSQTKAVALCSSWLRLRRRGTNAAGFASPGEA